MNQQQRLRGRNLFSFITLNLKLENKLVRQQHHEIFLLHIDCREINWVHIFHSSEASNPFLSECLFLLKFLCFLLICFIFSYTLSWFLSSSCFLELSFPFPWPPTLPIAILPNLWTLSPPYCKSAQQYVFLFSDRDAVAPKLFLPVFCTGYQSGTEENIILAPEWKQQISMKLWAVCYFSYPLQESCALLSLSSVMYAEIRCQEG